ncbi:hypothetical protein SAMD00019534_071870 [Acytostelium subglobosum LB1]|uniref:hypothetical protein n=1 Tax=Acytostelium subglobosum LB1 TaxID=1410327 RepID=UPI000644C085|nr:hypothetical protein SAMD00019534_071870 [Acytostelium subglobosum LB1]GAM24012.1 hypothetical protein SAMD00019534_071870 [Acytostelium subglobosum LB1]|eukprot:XP_012753048.1 hypothetical protein SAMD00019534_071870 [Acytostelium subglobosum LB1]
MTEERTYVSSSHGGVVRAPSMEKEDWELTIEEKKEIIRILVEEHQKYEHITEEYLDAIEQQQLKKRLSATSTSSSSSSLSTSSSSSSLSLSSSSVNVTNLIQHHQRRINSASFPTSAAGTSTTTTNSNVNGNGIGNGSSSSSSSTTSSSSPSSHSNTNGSTTSSSGTKRMSNNSLLTATQSILNKPVDLVSMTEEDILQMLNGLRNKIFGPISRGTFRSKKHSLPAGASTGSSSSSKSKSTMVDKHQQQPMLNKKVSHQSSAVMPVHETYSSVTPQDNLPSFVVQQPTMADDKPSVPLHLMLSGIKVEDIHGNTVAFTSFWQSKRCVVAVFRRFGCLVCRIQAMDISSLKPKLDRLGISLIGIGFETLGLQDFIAGKYFAGDIYIDKSRAVYRALSLRRMGFWDSAVGLMDPRLSVYRKLAKETGMPSNFRGDGLQLGATLVIGPKPQGAHYDFRQKTFVDAFDLNKILSACKKPYPKLNYAEGVGSGQTSAADSHLKDVVISLPTPVTVSIPHKFHLNVPESKHKIESNPLTHNPFKQQQTQHTSTNGSTLTSTTTSSSTLVHNSNNVNGNGNGNSPSIVSPRQIKYSGATQTVYTSSSSSTQTTKVTSSTFGPQAKFAPTTTPTKPLSNFHVKPPAKIPSSSSSLLGSPLTTGQVAPPTQTTPTSPSSTTTTTSTTPLTRTRSTMKPLPKPPVSFTITPVKPTLPQSPVHTQPQTQVQTQTQTQTQTQPQLQKDINAPVLSPVNVSAFFKLQHNTGAGGSTGTTSGGGVKSTTSTFVKPTTKRKIGGKVEPVVFYPY